MRHASFPMTPPRNVDELLHHMPTVAHVAENGWAKNFAKSIIRQSRRRGWQPSPKQESMMRALVSELFAEADEGDFDLIESPCQDNMAVRT